MSLLCATNAGAEDAMNAVLHLSLRTVEGGRMSVQIPFEAPPADEGLWATQASVHLGDRTLRVEQGLQGIVRLRMEPPQSEVPILWVWRDPPLPGRESPPQ